MRNWFWAVTALLFLGSSTVAICQENNRAQTSAPKTKGVYAGGQASTNGLGFNIKYILSKSFTFKAGYETLNFDYGFNFDENDIRYDATMDLKTGGFFILANWFYTPSLYFTGGAILNQFQPGMSGFAVSDLEYGDISIPASEVGNFSFHFEPDMKISPYVGIGFRKFLGKSQRVSYNFETGLYYIGPPKLNIEATGLLSPTADPAHRQKENLEEQFSVYKYYPVVKFDIAIRLF